MLTDQSERCPILIGTAARMSCDCVAECDANGRPNDMRICNKPGRRPKYQILLPPTVMGEGFYKVSMVIIPHILLCGISDNAGCATDSIMPVTLQCVNAEYNFIGDISAI